MRTSLNDIKLIDDYLLGNMATADRLLFEAKMLLNGDLKEDVRQQQSTHTIITEYGRKSVKAEIRAVQQILATAPQHSNFMQRIVNLFKK